MQKQKWTCSKDYSPETRAPSPSYRPPQVVWRSDKTQIYKTRLASDKLNYASADTEFWRTAESRVYKRTNYHRSHWLASRLSEPTAAPVYEPSLRGWPGSRASTILRVHPKRSSRRCLHLEKARAASGCFRLPGNQRARHRQRSVRAPVFLLAANQLDKSDFSLDGPFCQTSCSTLWGIGYNFGSFVFKTINTSVQA